ncbi:response regulator [Bradyrhizobium sp. CSS354]|jgi:FixJ family two-component response regulator|uniref:response regulator n=1 Tax=Bradyrhizobium sp. CSS354 TaxID=2699172 RepID=UPI0023B1E686|nr:response regulator [Bradyrhizobium sp. CSS354]
MNRSSSRLPKSWSSTPIANALCIILDINLNLRSGIDLRHQLKARGVLVPVIFITGNETDSVREAALLSGCLAFPTKPFSAHELIEPLKQAAAGH